MIPGDAIVWPGRPEKPVRMSEPVGATGTRPARRGPCRVATPGPTFLLRPRAPGVMFGSAGRTGDSCRLGGRPTHERCPNTRPDLAPRRNRPVRGGVAGRLPAADRGRPDRCGG